MFCSVDSLSRCCARWAAAPGVFLLGLSGLASEREQNLRYLKELPWLDIPITYRNGALGVLAIEKGAKNRVYSAMTELHKNAQKPDLYYGYNKTYESKDEGGEQFPAQARPPRSIPDVFGYVSHLVSLRLLAPGNGSRRRAWSGNVPETRDHLRVFAAASGRNCPPCGW